MRQSKIYQFSLYNWIGMFPISVLRTRVKNTIDNVKYLGITIEQSNKTFWLLKWVRLRMNIIRLGKYLYQINKQYEIKGFLASIMKINLVKVDGLYRYSLFVYPSFYNKVSTDNINNIVKDLCNNEAEWPKIVINYETGIKKESRTQP